MPCTQSAVGRRQTEKTKNNPLKVNGIYLPWIPYSYGKTVSSAQFCLELLQRLVTSFYTCFVFLGLLCKVLTILAFLNTWTEHSQNITYQSKSATKPNLIQIVARDPIWFPSLKTAMEFSKIKAISHALRKVMLSLIAVATLDRLWNKLL